ncbi:uncharacterized protein BDR25DRAFT_332885 [Lindgomyces ingoldianus]|uniref:Uncharacterized protein n=1 Tax=Lindgomyces ingoldianus TaxID=673940 RepID=A0ACB6R290_9PLEO|nr:uncharacterized protein BDR25DRAFT_332885 [Lindgomyces ingoldianus]KAF2473261.1 hypothetical protein BDR25DRAFT_332885 [Lindgomyces ingoldianus]
MAANTSFADFVKEAREKKKKQELAQEMFGRGRNLNASSGPGAIATSRNGSQKPTLASRMGVTKQRSASAKPNIDGKWKHDLHNINNPDGPPKTKMNRTASASQIERNTRTFNKFRSTLQNNADTNAPASRAGSGSGFSIRGVAAGGPYTVIASNFAPGTTAADIEAVMAPIGGEISRCKLISSKPTVMVEMIMDSKDGAENVIATFNNKMADGRQLYVYMKDTPKTYNGAAPTRPSVTPVVRSSYDDMDVEMASGARNNRRGSWQDGTYGFPEEQSTLGAPRNAPRGPRRRY